MTLKDLAIGRGELIPPTINVVVEKKRKDDDTTATGPARALSFEQWCAIRQRSEELSRHADGLRDQATGLAGIVQDLVRGITKARPRSCQCGGVVARSGAAADCDCLEAQVAEFCCMFLMFRDHFDWLADFAGRFCAPLFADESDDAGMSELQRRLLGTSSIGRSVPEPAARADEAERARRIRKLIEAKLSVARAARRVAQA